MSIPSLLPTIQGRLLDSISLARPAAALVRGTAANIPQPVSELSGSALVQLALQTLACFNFTGHELLEFARESVVVYLDDEDGATRKDAALCCCKLVANSFSGAGVALVARLLEGTGVNANNGIISGVLVTVGDLARVGGFAMREYIPELMPLTVEALLDGAAVTKREVAVATLRQVVQSTGNRKPNAWSSSSSSSREYSPGTLSRKQMKHVAAEKSSEAQIIKGRMVVELNDYPGSGANNRHTPRPQFGRCADC
ncbi:hypothetical protein QQP08_010424 [Theobroma cacao]|nr:hypothetical protein QQP08_010424 [Theobroma cacao]